MQSTALSFLMFVSKAAFLSFILAFGVIKSVHDLSKSLSNSHLCWCY